MMQLTILSLSLLEIINYLENKGISKDYSNPMQRKGIERLGENKCRKIYNNIISTHNLVNITQVKGRDLNIIDTNKFQYILTYSFPCQDLSLAGQKKGMAKGSETRSGLLWEVERILDELVIEQSKNGEKLPILLMENVTQIHSKKNINDFNKWLEKLESLGYTNFVQDINSKDYGVPQSRNRTFCLSIPRKEVNYTFLPKIELKTTLFDLLEENNVDEKLFLSDKQIQDILKWKAFQKPLETCERTMQLKYAPTLTTRSGAYTSSMVLVKQPKCIDGTQYSMAGSDTIRRLTPKECFRLMGVKDEDFEKIRVNQTNASLYHLAGDSIVINSLIAVLKNLFI